MQLIQPDNPMSVISLFDAEKKSLDYFVDFIVNSIESGSDDPLKVLAMSKKMDYVTERIRERIKENIKKEAAKYGDKPFAFAGTEMHLTPTYTKYQFDKCNDPEWEAYDAGVKSSEKFRKEREDILKTLKAPMTIIDPTSGEVVEIYPPVKVQQTGVKVTIK